jgi:hypothetical protein
MNDITFDFAGINELEDIMTFMSMHWSENHIYSISKKLLIKEFLWLDRTDKLTIGLAKDKHGDILGMFCFKFFNYSELPDLAGALWKVTIDAEKKHQMIGIRLRQFVLKNVKHRFFSAPGPGEQTKGIYNMLRLQWNQMKQYYTINPLIKDYKLIKFLSQDIVKSAPSKATCIKMKRAENADNLLYFDFDSISNIVPFKDKRYIENRFFNYPFYDYDVFLVYKLNELVAQNIVVCRKAIAKDNDGNDIASAYRMVDYYGTEDLLPEIVLALFEKVKSQGDEFLDFVCHGFDEQLLKQAGMTSLNFDGSDVIIPNWFEPLVKKNIPVNCIADVTTYNYRQCKADGDQDRPNYV